MATVRIYYSRSDNNQSDYDIFWWEEDLKTIDHSEFYAPFITREKVSFGDNDYVDIDLGDKKVIQWYIKRKDNTYDHNNELCMRIRNNTIDRTCGPLCGHCYDTGYWWKLDLTITPQNNFYINNTSPYVYRDDTYTDILANSLSFAGVEPLEGDGDNELPVDDGKVRISYTIYDYHDVEIPEDEIWYTKWEPWGDYYKTTINRIQLLYCLNKSYTIGENDMQLSIDASALQAEKEDAQQMLEKAVANCLYKLGEVIEDFDENAFLADVDGYKATKASTLGAVIDYLEISLNALQALPE
jgi:hypothetical protein